MQSGVFFYMRSRGLISSPDLWFLPSSFFSFLFYTSIASCFPACLPPASANVKRCHRQCLLGTSWVWPLVFSKVSFIHLHKFPQESKQSKPVFSELIMYLCAIISLMAGANFPCPLYSWHIICYDTMPREGFRDSFHTDCEDKMNMACMRCMEAHSNSDPHSHAFS